MARDIIVATFDTRSQAYDTAYDIDQMDDSVVDVTAGAIVEKDPLGNVTSLDTRNVGSAWGTLGGVAGGVLVGALIGAIAGPAGVAAGATIGSGAAAGGLVGGGLGATADAANWSLNQGFIDDVKVTLQPGNAALIMEVEEGATAPIDEAVARHSGVLHRRLLTHQS